MFYSSILICVAVSQLAAADDDAQTLQAIRVAYQANRERLRQGVCSYSLIQGTGRSIADARQGTLAVSIKADCYFAFTETNARLDRDYALELMASKTRIIGGRRVVTPTLTVHCLTDGKNTLCDNVGVEVDSSTRQLVHPARESHRIRIERGKKPFLRELEFPLRIGHPEGDLNDLAYALDQVTVQKEAARLISLDLDTLYEASTVARIVIARSNSRVTYLVDLNKGCIPRKVHSINNKTKREFSIYYDDIREVGNAVYLPYRETLYFNDGETKHIAVATFHLGAPPAGAFDWHLQEPVRAVDNVHRINLAPRKTFGLADLIGTLRPRDRTYAAKGITPGPAAAELAGELEPVDPRVTTAGLAALIVGGIAVGGFVIVRKYDIR